MVKLLQQRTKLQTNWFSYKGGNSFQSLEKPPELDGKSKELFLIVKNGEGYTSGTGYLIRLVDSCGREVVGGCRRSDLDCTLSHDFDNMLSLARGKYGG
jgi:hypothetical protein